MKQIIFRNWNFMRLIRLGLGIAILVQSVMANNWPMSILALLFIAMPVFNMGCCGTTGCAAPVNKSSEPTKSIRYEEVV